MIVSPAFAGKRYAVLGLARSGLATVLSLVASGAEVTAWDSDEAKRAVAPTGVTLGDPMEIELAGFDGIVVSPGVPLNTHPIAARAKAAGVPVIGDIELFAQGRGSLPEHKVVAITGTNGKSTTTALIHHILQTAGVPTTLGGNIGLPILGQEPLPTGGVYVLELSSFQIDLTFTLDADVAVLTNITPDHLDRYDGFEAYAASKWRLFEMQSRDHVALVDWNVVMAGLAPDPHTSGRGTYFGINPMERGMQAQWPALQGPHNAENAAAAYQACSWLGIDPNLIEQGLRTYPGLPHRMQRVAEIDGVLYVNDSKATNATSTAPALGAYPRIHWILGGRRKTDDLDACKPFYGHVVSAWTIGEAAELFEKILLESGIHARNVGTLDRAVKQAAQIARPGEVVLLSPACASYDQFRDYEARGDAFRAAVAMLGSTMGGGA
ncbi:UDP-N-acetylmuramoyl-L-alanine--D-glutamate ligase [Nostoc sp. 3335mG]|nr:UDP-N-acetylmuramoyl-L-alanine--D-glutamate ligase [Nostoc sp. 3335mG]